MTEKLLSFPSSTPLSYLPRPWGWGLKVEIQLFPVQHQHNPDTTKDICTRTPCVDPGIFCQGGGGVQAPQLILQFKEGSNGFITHFPGGGSNFFQGWGSHITITCDFPGGSGPPIPPLDPHMDIVHFCTNRLRRACAASF